MGFELGPVAAASGFALSESAETGSTNADLLALAGQGSHDRLWRLAGRQTAGRGRRGRVWQSRAGDLHASVLLLDPAPAACAAQLCFVAGVALADAVLALPGADGALSLKWPNDCLLHGAKLAGILVEATGPVPGAPLAVCIGFGVNIVYSPFDPAYPTAALVRLDPLVSAPALFAALSDRFAERLGQWDRGAGFAAIRQAWLARAGGLGGPVTARLPGETLTGRFETLDGEGRLVLVDGAGRRRTVAAGDVFFAGQPAIAGEGAAGPIG